MRTTRARSAPAVATALAVLIGGVIGVGCRKDRQIDDPKPLRHRADGIDIWIDRSPAQGYSVMTTEDVTLDFDAKGRRDFLMRADAAVRDAAVRRAKAIGADAVIMTTEADPGAADGRHVPRRLKPMVMYAQYDAPPAGPTTAPVTPAP